MEDYHDRRPHVHSRGAGSDRLRALGWALAINAAFLAVEVVGGILSGSLALLADAGHMASDVASLAVSLWVARVALRGPSKRRTFGYGRVEVLSGLLSGLALWAVVGVILYEAVLRLLNPPEVEAETMIWVALAGLAANLGSAAILFRHRRHDLNLKGAFLHLTADSVGSVGVIVAAGAILLGASPLLDPIVSVGLGLLIAWSSWSLVKESLHILLEGTPPGVDVDRILRDLREIGGVREVDDLHVWSIGSQKNVLTAHLRTSEEADVERIRVQAQDVARRHEIHHSTFELGPTPRRLPH
jgi:cobalt-zinc-cadmium efflux system protein